MRAIGSVCVFCCAISCAVLSGCGPDCSEGPHTTKLKDEDISGNALDAGQDGWCGVQFLDNPVEFGVRYIITGDTQGNPVVFNWTFPDGTKVLSRGDSANPAVRLGTVSGDVTVQAENSCGKSNIVKRPLTVLAHNALTKLPDFPEVARYGMSSFSLGGRGYIVGGVNQDGFVFHEVWELDPDTFKWKKLPDMPEEDLFRLGLAATVGDRAIVVISRSLYEFRPPSSWTLVSEMPYTSPTSFVASAGGRVFFGEAAEHGGRAKVWQYDPTSATWDAPELLASNFERVFGFGLGDALYVGAGCNTCDTVSPTLDGAWQGFDVPSQQPNGSGFSLPGSQFEAWTLTDTVVIVTEAGRFLFRPDTGVVPTPPNTEMICPLPVANIGAVGHGSFAIGDQGYRVMGYREDPPLVQVEVERYTL